VAVALLAVFFSALFINQTMENHNAVVRSAATAAIQLGAVTIIAWVMKGLERRSQFLAIAALTIVATHVGTAAVNSYRERTLARLARAKRVQLLAAKTRSLFFSTLESRSLAYYGLVLGFGAGIMLMRISPWRDPAVPLLGALIGTALFLLYETVRNGMLMYDPYDSLFHLEPEGGVASDDQLQDIAYSAAELRKTVFFSSVFAATIFLALSLLIVHVLAVDIPIKGVFVPTLIVLFLLVQLPYVQGQSRVHTKLLDAREGKEQGELREKLQKLAPLFPTLPTLAALTLPGTAGGVLYLALSKVLNLG
jgi:hypothetical protein